MESCLKFKYIKKNLKVNILLFIKHSEFQLRNYKGKSVTHSSSASHSASATNSDRSEAASAFIHMPRTDHAKRQSQHPTQRYCSCVPLVMFNFPSVPHLVTISGGEKKTWTLPALNSNFTRMPLSHNIVSSH